jgi:hypothetical protein
MKYAAEVGSGGMISIPDFIRTGSAVQEMIMGDTQTQHGDCISLTSFFPNKEHRLKSEVTHTGYIAGTL